MGYDHFALLAINPIDQCEARSVASPPYLRRPEMDDLIEESLKNIRKRVEKDNIFDFSDDYIRKYGYDPLYGHVHHLCAGSFGYRKEHASDLNPESAWWKEFDRTIHELYEATGLKTIYLYICERADRRSNVRWRNIGKIYIYERNQGDWRNN